MLEFRLFTPLRHVSDALRPAFYARMIAPSVSFDIIGIYIAIIFMLYCCHYAIILLLSLH